MALEARLEEALTGVSAGQTGVFVAVEGKGLAGAVALSDELRHDARWVVAEVQGRLGCRALVMSGDRPDTTEAIARLAGLPEGAGRGGMSPADKADEVAWLASEGRCVAVIGDGVNDAPAMARATVGVAMSGGLDAAGEAAGVVLMGDRLGQFVEAVDLSRAAAAKIRQNLAWALVYNTIGIPVAAGAALPAFGLVSGGMFLGGAGVGLRRLFGCLGEPPCRTVIEWDLWLQVMDPAVAGGMMALSSLAVVSNSLLLRAQYAMKPARTGVPLGAAERGHGAGEGDANGSPSTAALKRA